MALSPERYAFAMEEEERKRRTLENLSNDEIIPHATLYNGFQISSLLFFSFSVLFFLKKKTHNTKTVNKIELKDIK